MLVPEWHCFEGVLVSIAHEGGYYGYDDWVGQFPRWQEYHSLVEAIAQARSGLRVHVRGISTYESVELLRDYYRERWYEDILAKSYTIPSDELLTVSISLPHALWCEKDKSFLGQKNDHNFYGQIVPPVRTPADLRALQQALRMGIIIGIESTILYTPFLPELLSKQILTLYQIGTLLSRWWIIHGIKSRREEFSFPIPSFIPEEV